MHFSSRAESNKIMCGGNLALTSAFHIVRNTFEEQKMKKLIIAFAAVAILSTPVAAKTNTMHVKMVKMMETIKDMKAQITKMERQLQELIRESYHNG